MHQPDNTNNAKLPWVTGLSIGQVLRKISASNPNGEALVFCDDGTRLSWKQFDDAVDAIAKSLLSLGLGPGDHFGIGANNIPEWVLLQFATARIGVVLVTINPAYQSSEFEFALLQSELTAIAMIDGFNTVSLTEKLLACCQSISELKAGSSASASEHDFRIKSERFPKLRYAILLRGEAPGGILPWSTFLQRGKHVSDADLDLVINTVTPDQKINIQYTSGTTSLPKGVTLSHRNLLLNSFYAGQNQNFRQCDRLCIPVPLHHCFGCVLGTLCCVAHGVTMVFPSEDFSPKSCLLAIQNESCTGIYGVPAMFVDLLESQKEISADLSSLRTGIMAGSPCPLELIKRVTNEMHANEMTIGYGQTESSPLITQTQWNDPMHLRIGTVGRALPGVEVKIVEPESGLPSTEGTSGELCTRGHNVMLGYFNMPKNTTQAIDDEGWLHTGDLATQGVDDRYRITGRIRDLIIRGGENISPREIEDRLHQHPAVADAQVVGVPDRKFGEEILACVVLESNHQASQQELAEHCSQTLSKFKVPRYWRFVESYPKTSSGKALKCQIRACAIRDLGLEDIAGEETA